jgi:hypothetical protein
LLNVSDELRRQRSDLFRVKRRRRIWAERLSIRVIRVGGKTEPHRAAISFAPTRVKAGESCCASERQHQHTCCERIERSEMADLAKADEPAHGFNDIVRSFSARLINDKDTVDGRRLWLPGHTLRLLPRTFCVSQQLIDAIANFFRLIEDEQHFRGAAKLQALDEFMAHIAFRSL